MNLLGIDYGHKRIGLAYADSKLGVAVPIPAAVAATENARLEQIATVIIERRIDKIVIGYPFNMDGTVSDTARDVDVFVKKLDALFALPVARTDERLSSFQAEHDYFAISSKAKKSVAARKKYRRTGDIDSRAAALFLQEFVDNEGKRQ